MGWLRRIWQKIVAFHEGRLVSSITSFTKEQHEQELANQLEKAKRLSDFVGIIIRWSFVMFAALYFWRLGATSDSLLMSLLWSFCAGWAWIMTVFFAARIQTVILLWWSDSVYMHPTKVGKRISLMFSLLFTGIAAFGIFRLVSDVARASTLLPK